MTEPIDRRPLLGNDDEPETSKPDRRHDPREWHRRGLLAPAELHALVTARSNGIPATQPAISVRSEHLTTPHEPSYDDFLGEPTA